MEIELDRRNVEVFDSNGIVLAGFWQYGTVQWDEFYRYLTTFFIASTDWRVFHYPAAQQPEHGAECSSGPDIVHPGHYIVLSSAGEPIQVRLDSTPSRLRQPTHTNTPAQEAHYRTRGHARDRGRCLITGLQSLTHSRLQVAHIFPRAHDLEWVRKGYPSKITDTAEEAVMGGPTKIDSVQNVITIRSDLHNAWDNYEFGVDPNNGYRVTAFTNGNADINGRHLQLSHIEDQTLRPLDELFQDHFMQGLFKFMKGLGDPAWTWDDHEDTFGAGSLCMSHPKLWETKEGKEQLELALVDRLFKHRMIQQKTSTVPQ